MPAHARLRGQNPRSQRILLVEDDTDIRQLASEFLIRSGYQVGTAADGQTGSQLSTIDCHGGKSRRPVRESGSSAGSLSRSKTSNMKHKTILLSLLTVAAIAVGCNQEPSTSQQLDKVQEKTSEAAQDMKDYTFAQKAEFVKQMQSQLTALDQDLDKLSAKIESSSAAVKAEAKPKLQALRDQASQLNKQLDEVKNASESAWDNVKNGFKKAYESSKDGFNQARQWVSDKIAP